MGKNNTQRKFINILSDTSYDQDVLVCIMLEVCSLYKYWVNSLPKADGSKGCLMPTEEHRANI